MHDLIVLSDLHLGRGRNRRTGRFHTLETFFFDDDLRRFFGSLIADAKTRVTPLRILFNGDTFDLLRRDPLPMTGESYREQRFGPDLTPVRAAAVLAEHLAGHPVFVEALVDVLLAGHELVFLPGNHDLELQWEPVQDELRRTVEARLVARGASDVPQAMGRLVFRDWFHHEPGRIWIEHGCQYDDECSFRFPLRRALGEQIADTDQLELDLPLGSFLQRYLFNGFGPITFIVPSTRANARYLRYLLVNEPRLLAQVFASHIPFIVQFLRRLAQKGVTSARPVEAAHATRLAELANESGLGEKLTAIDALKLVGGDLVTTAREYGKQGLRGTFIALFAALSAAGLWFSGFEAIQGVDVFGMKTILFVAMNILLTATVAGSLIFALLRQPATAQAGPLRRSAQKIAELLDVPIVTFGHTHDEVIHRLQRPQGADGWYFNTGTWIAVFTHDVLIPRERVQYTFLRVRGTEAELLHWSPGRGEAAPVILLDDLAHETPTAQADVPMGQAS